MARARAARPARRRPAPQPTRFAHPFFTTVAPEKRSPVNGVRRMTDHVKEHLETIPPVTGDAVMTLADVIGADGSAAIETAGQMIFHCVGDTGHENGAAQEYVANAMTEDYDIAQPAKSPAFFLHLGDVIYYDNTDRGYHAQFYAPYKKYPGKIVAIPGNHDGELFKYDGKPTGQRTTLQAFQTNFCQKGARTAISSGTILRNMVSQPGVYWRLQAPFVDIVGLYSNVAENPGYISGPTIGDAQKRWLTKTLNTIRSERAVGTRRALLIAVHHPPISNGAHSSSTEMLTDVDDSCTKARVAPDAVIAAHSHDYQRFTRFVKFGGRDLEVPYLVVGSGGRGLSPHVPAANGQMQGDHRYDKSLRGYGYLRTTVSRKMLSLNFFRVDEHDGSRALFDQASVDLSGA